MSKKLSVAVTLVLSIIIGASAARAAEIKLLTTGAFKPEVLALVPDFEKQTGHKVTVDNGTAGELKKRIEGGEVFDVAVIMLAELGCAVVGPAAKVNQALAMIEANAIDLAVLDVNLNGEMSYPIADALTARGVPFVFVTGYHKDRMLEGYRNCPVLQKPFHRAELTDMLAKLLAPKELSAEPVIVAITKRRSKIRPAA